MSRPIPDIRSRKLEGITAQEWAALNPDPLAVPWPDDAAYCPHARFVGMPCPWCLGVNAPVPEMAAWGPDEDVARLRRQNHEYAARRDREMAALRSQVAKYHSAADRARALVRGTPVDWSKDPKAQEPDGWWNYTSQGIREVILTAVLDARSSDHAVLLARARRARLAQVAAFLVGLALGAAAGVVVAGVWR